MNFMAATVAATSSATISTARTARQRRDTVDGRFSAVRPVDRADGAANGGT